MLASPYARYAKLMNSHHYYAQSHITKQATKNPINATALPATALGGAWLVPLPLLLSTPCWKLVLPPPWLPPLEPEDPLDPLDPVPEPEAELPLSEPPLLPRLPPPETPGTVFGVADAEADPELAEAEAKAEAFGSLEALSPVA